jgi:voltage-dependent potassium channel beta subunit
MRHRQLGKWGVRLSEVGLGSWLTFGGSVEEATAHRCIETAYDRGVTFFDTANVYMRGRSEEVVGAALAQYARDSYVLATKVFIPMGDRPNDRGLSRKHITEQLHHSLRRLDTDYVDLYQCHRFDHSVPLEETCRTMDDLIRQGKVLYWGTSEWEADELEAATDLCNARGWAPPVSNQPQYSAVYRRIEDGVLQTSEQNGIGNVVWSPLAMGVLTGKYRVEGDMPEGSRGASEQRMFMDEFLKQPVLDAVQTAVGVAKEAGLTPAQLALAWCLRQTMVSSVIVGASRPEQLHDTLAAGELDVPADVLEAYDAALAPVAVHQLLR